MRGIAVGLLVVWAGVAAAGEVPGVGTRYSCGFLPGAKLLAVAEQTGPADAVMIELEELVRHPDAALMERALYQVSALDVPKLDVVQRIVVQNLLLQMEWGNQAPEVAMEARALVRWLALPPVVLDAIGSEPEAGLAFYVGPRAEWVERRGPSCGDAPLVHEYKNRGALAYRPLRTGRVRALVAQRVAIDSRGIPHVTPLVAQVEMRGGISDGAPACALEFDPHALAAGRPAGLRAQALAELSHPPFVMAKDGAATCYGCHADDGSRYGFEDVPAAEADALNLARREVLLGLAAQRLGWVSSAN